MKLIFIFPDLRVAQYYTFEDCYYDVHTLQHISNILGINIFEKLVLLYN